MLVRLAGPTRILITSQDRRRLRRSKQYDPADMMDEQKAFEQKLI